MRRVSLRKDLRRDAIKDDRRKSTARHNDIGSDGIPPAAAAAKLLNTKVIASLHSP